MIGIGYLLNNKTFKGYGKIFRYSGKLVTDFTQLMGYGLTLINMGIMGLISMFCIFHQRGIQRSHNRWYSHCCGILSLWQSSRKLNPHNGRSILWRVLKVWDIQTTPTIIAGLFGTTLAPIAGRYGAYAGVLAGFLHLSMVMNIGVVHGGTNLYNNGFSGGLIASILVPVFECFRKEE